MKIGLKKILLTFSGALALGALVCFIFIAHPELSNGINNLIYDFWLTSQEPDTPGERVAVIDIDETSLKKIGQLPWPRSVIADLISILTGYGASAVGLDIWMTEPDRSSPIAVDGLLEKNFGLNLDLSSIPLAAQDNDRYLRDLITGKKVVLGAYAAPAPDDSQLPDGIQITTANGTEDLRHHIKKADGLIPPLALLSSVAPVGILNLNTDTDGIVRKTPLLTRIGDAVYPSLALATLMADRGANTISLVGDKSGLTALKLGDQVIPVEADSSFRPVYRGPGRTLPFYSALDILEGRISPKDLADKILFVGSSAHTLSNQRSTPFDPEMPDTEIHATIVDDILGGSSIRSPAWSKPLLIAAIFVISLCAVAAFSFLGLPVYVILMSVLACLCAFISWLFFKNGIFISPATPLLTIMLAGIAIVPVRYWREQRERHKLELAFGRYVPPEIVSQIMSDGEQLLRGEQKQITVLFSDVRNFTAISEKLDPQRLVHLLNSYFTPMTICVINQQGTLDKFIGDALMAFWNAPLDLRDHSAKAVTAALNMQKELAIMRPEIEKQFGIKLYMGIGLSTGIAHIGNMGSKELLDYTCIGETVNLASRLEGMCKRYGVGIVVSEAVHAACPDGFKFLPLDRVSVKGSARPINIFTPLSENDAPDEEAARIWRKALAAYFSGSFAAAAKDFRAAGSSPFLKAAARLFIDRCADLEKRDGSSWDGVWKYNEK